MKDLDKRLREYKDLHAKIDIIDLDIELFKMYGKNTYKLQYFKKVLINESMIIENIINKLTSQENFLLNRIYIDEMTISDIARVLKINRSTCYTRKERILTKIKEYLKDN